MRTVSEMLPISIPPSGGISKGTSIALIVSLSTAPAYSVKSTSIECGPASSKVRNETLPGRQANPSNTCCSVQSLNGCANELERLRAVHTKPQH